MVQFESLATVFYSRGSILHHLWDDAKCWSKIAIWPCPCTRRPVGSPHRNTVIPFGIEKLEWCGYPTVKSLMIWHCLTVLTQHRRVTNR